MRKEISVDELKGLKGNWVYDNNKIFGYNIEVGDRIAISDYQISSDDAIVYEATVTRLNSFSNACGLVFGLEDKCERPEKWFVALVDFGQGVVGLNRRCYGSIGAVRQKMTDEELAKDTHKLRVEILGNQFSFYLNDRFIGKKQEQFYRGGYLGVLTCKSQFAFSDLSVETVEIPQIISVKTEEAEMGPEIEFTDYSYNVSVPFSKENISISMEVDKDSIAFINDIQVPDNQVLPIDLHPGSQIISLVAQNKNTGVKHYEYMHIYRDIDLSTLYKENYRPQLHFTSKINWINDPNGLMYNAKTKEYHLYYQYNPYGYDWGNMHWGHAVSKDLISWEEREIALYPDKLGTIFSGSGVIDKKNVTGLFDEDIAPESRMLAFYTYDPGDEEHGQQNIALAYSLDDGDTWIKYNNGESIIANPRNKYTQNFRDPKVIWVPDKDDNEYGGKWLLIVAGGRARIFTSNNLIDWTHNNDLFCLDEEGNKIPLISECPDIYPLTIEGTNVVKWVYTGSGEFFVVGELIKDDRGFYDFQPETTKLPCINMRSRIYATQSFYNDPKNRRLQVAWVRDVRSANVLDKFGKVWNCFLSIPKEVALRQKNGSYQLAVKLPEELNSYKSDMLLNIEDTKITENSENILKNIKYNKLDIETTIDLGTCSEVGFNLCVSEDSYMNIRYDKRNGKLILDKSKTQTQSIKVSANVETMDYIANDNILNLHILLDVSAIDVYADYGTVGTTAAYYTDPENLDCCFYVNGGEATIKNMSVYSLRDAAKENYEKSRS